MILLGFSLFVFMLRKQGVSFSIVAGQNTDPYFFAGVFSILIPLFTGFFLEMIMVGIRAKKSALEITKDVGKDVAAATAVALLDVIIGGGGSADNRTSGDGRASGGGGGAFSGGGASEGF